MNQKAVQLLAQWDPFRIGADNYDTETADVVAALHRTSEVTKLAVIIQSVYEHSFEQWIELERCQEIANKLMELKMQLNCNN